MGDPKNVFISSLTMKMTGVVRKVAENKNPWACKNRKGTLNAPTPQICSYHEYN